MPFNLFHKKKPEETPAVPLKEAQPQPEPEATAQPQEIPPVAPVEEPTLAPIEPAQPQPVVAAEPPVEQNPEGTPTAEAPSKTYLKAMPLRELSDLENVKTEILNGNIIILKVTPLAQKSIEDVKNAVNDLYQFAETIGGDIARLGEERVVICPKSVRIWREKSPKPVSNEPLPTAA
jgi:uncharacterized protein